MKILKNISLAVLASVTVASAANAAVLVSYEGEAPGVQNTTATFSVKAVETFDEQPADTYPSSFSQSFSDNGSTVTMNFSGANGVQINPADQYGGAGGTGNYVVAFENTPFSLDLSSSNVAGGVNYFGYWLSALDAGNVVNFYGENNQLLFSFNPQDVLNVVTGELNSGEYYGNPNDPFKGANSGQPYIFLNFFDTTGTFSKIEYVETGGGGGYESDNYTVGHYTGYGLGTFIPTPLSNANPVPEPATWALLIAGFGAIGFAMRRRTNLRGTIAFAA